MVEVLARLSERFSGARFGGGDALPSMLLVLARLSERFGGARFGGGDAFEAFC
jgi:hypothetical protein